MAAPRKKPAKSKPAADPPPAAVHPAPPRKSAAKPLVGVAVKTAVAVAVIITLSAAMSLKKVLFLEAGVVFR